jgi:hypothetical protein
MKIEYNVKLTQVINKSVEIQNDDFIPVKHYVDGLARITAFIGKGEGNIQKLSITVSPYNCLLDIKRMYGSAAVNAQDLLKRDIRHKVIAISDFIKLYNVTKERLAIYLHTTDFCDKYEAKGD